MKPTITKSKRKLCISSWSDHIINGIRVQVLKESLDYEQLSINFFDNNLLTAISMDSHLAFLVSPGGFMDQNANDIMKLLDIRNE